MQLPGILCLAFSVIALVACGGDDGSGGLPPAPVMDGSTGGGPGSDVGPMAPEPDISVPVESDGGAGNRRGRCGDDDAHA